MSDDDTQAAFHIPFATETSVSHPHNIDEQEQERVFLLASYHSSWTKCLSRIQEAIKTLYAPSVQSVMQSVRRSHTEVLPGLPIPEIPVIYVPDSAGVTYLVPEVTLQLERISPKHGYHDNLVNHLFPLDCTNISQCMKSLITGFMNKYNHEFDGVRKSTLSLPDNNIELLLAWYNCFGRLAGASLYIVEVISPLKFNQGSPSPKLVIIFHEIERFDPNVLIDMLHICSLHAKSIPLAFIMLASSPLPSFLSLAYPASTLSLIRVEYVNVPVSTILLDEIIMQTFFAIGYEPELLPGPEIIEYLLEHFHRVNPSLNAAITILQLMHMQHYSHSLILFNKHHSPEDLARMSSLSHISILSAMLENLPRSKRDEAYQEWSQSIDALSYQLKAISNEFYTSYRRMTLGINVMRQAYLILEKIEQPGVKSPRSWLRILIATFKNEHEDDVSQMTVSIKNLSSDNLSSLGTRLHRLFESLPNAALDRFERIASQEQIIDMINNDASQESPKEIAEKSGSWFQSFLGKCFESLWDNTLAELWLANGNPSVEVLKPSTRRSILTGLLRPYDYTKALEEDTIMEAAPAMWDNSDTGILFSLYQESGRIINVQDWFDAFCLQVGKQEEDTETNEQDHEDQKLLQARFIRALQELDYLGFIKHTGRKKDHVTRTVFDLESSL